MDFCVNGLENAVLPVKMKYKGDLISFSVIFWKKMTTEEH